MTATASIIRESLSILGDLNGRAQRWAVEKCPYFCAQDAAWLGLDRCQSFSLHILPRLNTQMETSHDGKKSFAFLWPPELAALLHHGGDLLDLSERAYAWRAR